MKIIFHGNDLALVIPEHGTYLFKNYYLTNFNISIENNIQEILMPGDYNVYHVPGIQTITADIKIGAASAQNLKQWTGQYDQYDHLSILELFDLIKNKLEKRD